MCGLSSRGFGLLLLLFALPLTIPLPVPPGYTTVLGSPLVIFSVQMFVGKSSPGIPGWLGRRRLSRTLLATFIEKTSPALVSIEKVLRPRFVWATDSKMAERIAGLMCLILAISITIPLPLTNFVPAIGIAIIALGLLGRDGLFVVIGFIIGIIGLSITGGVMLFGVVIMQKMLDLILGLF